MQLNKVLILDDDDLNIFLMGMTLKRIDFVSSFDSLTNGWEALKYLEKHKENPPEIILVDLNMPEMDGFEFIGYFEQQFYKPNTTTKIIVVTSSQRESDKTTALAFESVIGFIHKPLSEESFKEVLAAIL